MTRVPVTLLISSERIQARISEMASEIARHVPKDVLIVGLLRGSFVFTADLIRALHAQGLTPQIDFLTLSSYGAGTISSGKVTIERDLIEPVAGRAVLVLDDILESGRTLAAAKALLRERAATSVYIAVLLEKSGKLQTDVKADCTGFKIDDKFVVGYGLDYANSYRELPYIGVIAP